jgi:Flp pilus assembly pilin Flp
MQTPTSHIEVAKLPSSKSQSRRVRQRGQGMTEYIIIVALVAVAAIAVYQSFGRVIRSQTAAIASELAGESSRKAISNAGKAAKEANRQIKNKSLKNYGTASR